MTGRVKGAFILIIMCETRNVQEHLRSTGNETERDGVKEHE